MPNTPKNESGLFQWIMMGQSIRQIWVNTFKPGGTWTDSIAPDVLLKKTVSHIGLFGSFSEILSKKME